MLFDLTVKMTNRMAYNRDFDFATNVNFLPNGAGLVAETTTGLVLIDITGKVVATVDAKGVVGPSLIGAGSGLNAPRLRG